MLHKFPYEDFPSIELPEGNLAGIYRPAEYSVQNDEKTILQNALANPIGTNRLDRIVKAGMKIVIAVDDITRSTRTELMLPLVLGQLRQAKIDSEDISIFIALGTHRQMTGQEIRLKYTKEAAGNYRVINPDWKVSQNYQVAGRSSDGFEIRIHKAILESDFVIGLGQTVPHMYAGFGGGGKIINPGCSEEQTIGQMHWLSHTVASNERFGIRDNKIRQLIDDVAIKSGLKFILNEVPTEDSGIAMAFAGEPIKAHRAACKFAGKLFAVKVQRADIVIADSYPADIDFWQSIKALYSAHFAVKKDGTLIFVTPSPEGVSSQHPEITEIGYKTGHEQIKRLVADGRLSKVVAANLWVGNEILQNSDVVFVTKGISEKDTKAMGLQWAASPDDALKAALERHGKDAKISVLCGASKIICQVQS
jgi:nickel-dependent lactate racemase